ncbi:MAG: hypothetical protein QXI53_05890, partial [Archaeoglobaceae archaeon]
RKITEKVPIYVEKYIEAQEKLSKVFVEYETEKVREKIRKAYATKIQNGEIEEKLWRIYTSLGH